MTPIDHPPGGVLDPRNPRGIPSGPTASPSVPASLPGGAAGRPFRPTVTRRTTRLPRMPTPVLLDCDPGHDDAIAILLAAAAARRDAVDLRAVTTVGGNAELEKVTLNARRVLTL